jgi:hypothetical protein
MSEVKKTPIVINDKEYIFEDMEPNQKLMVNHIADIEQKLGNLEFNIDQLKVAKEAFLNILKESLKPKTE